MATRMRIIVKLSDDALASYLAHPARKRYIAESLSPIEASESRSTCPRTLTSSGRKLEARLALGQAAFGERCGSALRREEAHQD